MSKHRSQSARQWAFFGNRSRPCYTILGVKIPLPADLSFQATERLSDKLTEAINNYAAARLSTRLPGSAGPSEEWLKAAAKCATCAWRAERRVVDPATGEPKSEFRLLHRDIEAIRKVIGELDIETIDLTGKAYDSGMALKVVSFESMPGLAREEITETIKPTILWQGKLLQVGEVIVGTPQSSTSSTEANQ